MSLLTLGAGLHVGGGGGGFSPTTLPGIVVYAENDLATVFTDAGVTLATNGQAVAQWNGKVGSQHLTDLGLGSGVRPLLRNPGGGVTPSLEFDGIDDLLASAALALCDGNGQHYMFAAVEWMSVSGNQYVSSIGGSANEVSRMWAGGGTSAVRSFDTSNVGTNDLGPVVTTGTKNTLIARITNNGAVAAAEIITNNVTDGTTALTTIRETNNGRLYAGSLTNSFWGAVKLRAIGVGTGTLSDPNVTSLHNYLAAL